MACSICFRDFGPRRKGCCASCTRATLYEPRLQHVSKLLAHENSHTHVEAIVRPGNDGVLASLPQDADWDAIARGIRSESLRRQRQEFEVANERLKGILEHSESLKKQMIQYREHLDAQKRTMESRVAELNHRRKELDHHRSMSIEPLDTTIRKTRARLQRTHSRSADARAQLCYTTSWLAGVKQEMDSRRKVTGRIILGGLFVPDLRELNGPLTNTILACLTPAEGEALQFQHINACLDNVCRLMLTWTHYLSICLPAEIILPHNDFPHAVIMPEKSSYRGIDLPYPAGASSLNASPSASRIFQDVQNIPRPRLLHLDRPLAKLAKEEPKAFALFIEGVTLLAWDLAWLCKTQGVPAINTFDELCDIGRNLWLFHRAAELRASDTTSHHGLTDVQTKLSKPGSPNTGTQFGVLSHDTALRSLAGYDGAVIMQNWRLTQRHRLVDKLRTFLLTEMTGAEWDVLSDKDFDYERDDEIAVLVGGNRSRKSGVDRTDAMSVMSIAPAETPDANQKSDKGWMRVRDRGSET